MKLLWGGIEMRLIDADALFETALQVLLTQTDEKLTGIVLALINNAETIEVK